MFFASLNHMFHCGAWNTVNRNVVRSYTTVTTRNSSLTVGDGFHPKLRAVINQLDGVAPRFLLKQGEISILSHPEEFYSLLKEKIAGAQKRIFLSSLYIGKAQDELVGCLASALRENSKLKVSILADALRSTREEPERCPATLLAGLVEEFGQHRVDVRMYHTPHLNGINKAVFPRRLNEIWGLQHMKIYGFDHEVILSGANLSQDYFTNRQDRYYVFKSEKLSDYYFKVQSAIGSLSYQLLPSNSKSTFRLYWPSSNKTSEPHLNLERFIIDSTFFLHKVLKESGSESAEPIVTQPNDTVVYPVSQFTPLMKPDQSTEKPAILRLLSLLDSPTTKWTFTAGYFNMHSQLQKRFLSALGQGTIITAAPEANSFYKSGGISYYLPAAYLYNTKKFLESVRDNRRDAQINVYEWQNGIVNTVGGWSYHAKGIWITAPDENEPSITVVGSSNYTKRAYSVDLETNAVIITSDPDLKSKMQAEIEHLQQYTTKIALKDFEKEGRKISPGVVLATKILSPLL
ncbi:unnamed protein product [Kuraishia capsulata CBS 1993]|uniref:CDP-diacylglycerol--glycerol-3-phosphate 3-phosphatidyltransferase n=1 Tax=Kuraishia capsulata CBS 1993 TaxID=1382522 RepID=W6MMX8_9ASCO|nr:uncharacterized protein KUCA_T00003926001 [Kuraishia capsulata CBS 1993]CDK27946.1 unnamed protein product [Kuraishia capsulata CBS 1993]